MDRKSKNLILWGRFDALMTVHEVKLRPKIKRELNSFIAQAHRNVVSGRFNFDTDKHRRNIENILNPAYADIIKAFVKFTLADNMAKALPTGYEKKRFDLFSILLKQWVLDNAANQAKMISETSRDNIAAAIAATGEGAPIEDVAANVVKVAGVSGSRAFTIAATETHNAANYASISAARSAARELDLETKKEWLVNTDGRARDIHSDMLDRPPIGIDDKFNVGGEEMDRPGDPSASAKNIVNCRCSLAYISN
jgi:hypothetical protein